MKEISYSKYDVSAYAELNSHKNIGKRGAQIFKFLILRNDFKDFVFEIRNKVNIPENGINYQYVKERKLIKYYEHMILRKYFSTDWKVDVSGYNDFSKQELDPYRHLHKRADHFSDDIDFSPEIEKSIFDYIRTSKILDHLSELKTKFVFVFMCEYIVFNRFDNLCYKRAFAYHQINWEKDTLDFSFPLSAKTDEVKDYAQFITKFGSWRYERYGKRNNNKKRIKFDDKFFEKINLFNRWQEIEEEGLFKLPEVKIWKEMNNGIKEESEKTKEEAIEKTYREFRKEFIVSNYEIKGDV